MAEEWTPPTYMHKARASDTSFLNEKKRITGKDLKNRKKKIEKQKKKQNAMNSKKKNIKTEKRKKNIASPKSKQSEYATQTVLESIVNEYESSESEDDYKQETDVETILELETIIEPEMESIPLSPKLIQSVQSDICVQSVSVSDDHINYYKQATDMQTVAELQTITETQSNISDDSIQDNTDTNDIDQNINENINENMEDNINENINENIQDNTVKVSESENDYKQETVAQLQTITEPEIEAEVEPETVAQSQSLQRLQSVESNIGVQTISITDENDYTQQPLSPKLAQSVDSIICVKSVSVVSDDSNFEFEDDHKNNLELKQKQALDETSFFTILKTLDETKLDKDGNGKISCHYFRYYFKTKISKKISDQHILKIFQHINQQNNAMNTMYITTTQYQHFANKITSFLLDKILANKFMHKQYSSGNISKYYIDQTSLLSFLKTINIKHLNDDSGFVKLFDFGLYFQRNYNDFKEITDSEILKKIYHDIDRHNDGRITNGQYNQWVQKLNQTHLDKILSIKLPQNTKKNQIFHRKFLST